MTTRRPGTPATGRRTASNRPPTRTAAGRGDEPDVAVVGGGVCGLATALALERRGLSPTVYEAADAYGPVGAGVLLRTNAMLVLDRLGVAERVREAGRPLDGGGVRSPDGTFVARFDVDAVEREEFGYGFVAVHRADLLRVLREALATDVRTGMDCADVVGTAPPTVRFEDGTTASADVLVGADGVGSTVRDAVAPDVDPRPLDAVAYRALVDLDLPEPYRTAGFEVWGEGTYAGGAPVGEDRFYWFATAPGPLVDDRAAPEALGAALREHLAGYPEPLPATLDELDPADVVATGLADLPPLDAWSRDRVVLAGDAAHAVLPFAGQGAAQALEDAPTLADALATHDDPRRAFDAYERARRPRTDRVRRASRRLGRLGTLQSRLACRLRNAAVDAVPDAVVRRLRRRRAAGTTLPG